MLDKIKGMMGAAEEEEYEEYEEEDNTEYLQEEAYPQYEEAEPMRRVQKTTNMGTAGPLQVVLVKPEHFEDAPAIADHINAKRTVVLNLESTTKELARRLIDFLSGATYANHGQTKRVANSTFIITPYNVDIMGDLLDELESNGVFF